MNFADLFRSKRVRSKTFSSGVKTKQTESRFQRSSSDTACEVPGVPTPEETNKPSCNINPTTKALPRTKGGNTQQRLSSSELNLSALDSTLIRSSQDTARLQTSNVPSTRQTDVSLPEEGRFEVVTGDRKLGAELRGNYLGLCRKKSLSTSNIFAASTRKTRHPMESDFSTPFVLPFFQNGTDALFGTEVASVNTGKTSSDASKAGFRRRVSLVNENDLHMAIACDNDREVCNILDEQNLDPNETCQNALTLLHRAAIEGSYRCLKILLTHGADVNARDHDGWSPLHDAVFHGHVRCALALLISGADVEAETSEFLKPIEMAEDDDMVLIIGRAMTVYHDSTLSKPDRETLV